MGRPKKQITIIEEIAELLIKLDNQKKDRSVTITEFNKIDKEVIKNFLGKNITDWNEFKILFSEHQSNYGFIWNISSGNSGPLKLSQINLLAELGRELSEKLHKDKIEDGNFEKILKSNLPKLFSYLDSNIEILDYTSAKEEFKTPDAGTGYGYKFKPNSLQFKRKKLEYQYYAESGRHETELGNLVLKHIKEKLSLNMVFHSQEERDSSQYKNIDIEGIKVVKTESEDFFESYAFELKAKNSISAISESISQAINYKSDCNFSYIVIPNLEDENFHNENRLIEFLDMCRSNGIGAISINMKENNFEDLKILVNPIKSEIYDYSRLIGLSKKREFTLEKCHLCGKIVNKESRDNCGWAISIEGEEGSHCIKSIQELQAEEFLKAKK